MTKPKDTWDKFQRDLRLDEVSYSKKHDINPYQTVAKLRKAVAEHRCARVNALRTQENGEIGEL